MRLNLTLYSIFAVPCIPVTLFKHPTGFFLPDQIDSKCCCRKTGRESPLSSSKDLIEDVGLAQYLILPNPH